jgi:galactokinase
MIDYEWIRKEFTEKFGGEKLPRLFRAPGRVNLIGEHTDYNEGFVLPMAIDRETVAAVALRKDRKIRVYTANFDETAGFDLAAEAEREEGFWLNYIEGVARILERKGFALKGTDMLIYSDIPTGAGLSSSAALETAAGLALSEISGRRVERATLAEIGQMTEHEFVGAQVGIMDQFVSAHARTGHALLLDCRNLAYKHVPLDLKDFAVIICDTNVKHNLADSGYNTRRAECERAVELLKNFLPEIKSLRDVGITELEKYAENLPETLRRRARHVVTENARTLRAAEALERNDSAGFGRLMRESHESLKNDYEVSCRELDILVEIAGKIEGVAGSRMTGGGFGGSTVNLVARENLQNFERTTATEYRNQTGIEPTILVASASAGASEIG